MTIRVKPRPNGKTERNLTYRGLRILRSSAPTHFTDAQLDKAIEKALSKNARKLGLVEGR
jgi:hypothetical protein